MEEWRVWERVLLDDPDQCWEWQGGRSGSMGYGQIKVGGHSQYIHRLAYQQLVGPIPAGMKVLHQCDNPRCVNPHHLFLGTDGDNARDMASKGRAARGECNAAHKLTRHEVCRIKGLLAEGRWTLTEIAEHFGVAEPTIHHIKSGLRWGWLQNCSAS